VLTPRDEPRWVKAAASGNSNDCVEVAALRGDGVLVRDSRSPAGPRLRFGTARWTAFQAALRAETHGTDD
jgi:hypothetical protein